MKTAQTLIESAINSKALNNPSHDIASISALLKMAKANPEAIDKAVSQVEKSIAKGKYTIEQAFEVLENMKTRGTRDLRSFSNEAELHEFKKNNSCGEEWIKDGKFHIYKYED